MSTHHNKEFSFANRLKSFLCAVQGLKDFFKTQHNAWIEVIASFFVIIIGFVLDFSKNDWVVILLLIGFVFVTEILNTVAEKLCDIVSPEYSEKVRLVKDLAAAAVLVASITAGVVGLLIISKYF